MPRRTTILMAAVCGVVIALGASVPAGAQPGPPRGGDPQERVHQQMEHLTRELSLTEEQQQQVEPVLLDAARQVQAVFQSAGGRREELREPLQKIDRETDKKLEKILDEGQMKRYREIVQERRERMRQQGRRPR